MDTPDYHEFMKHVEKRGNVRTDGREPCWLYNAGRVYSHRYRAQIKMSNGLVMNPHRASLWLHTGCPELNDTMFACHWCDNIECCNPTHLYWGDATTNAADKSAKTRGTRDAPVKRNSTPCYHCVVHHLKCEGSDCEACKTANIECVMKAWVAPSGTFAKGDQVGEKNKNCKITDAQVADIRRRRMTGESLTVLATEYKMSYVWVQKVCAGNLRPIHPVA